MTRFAPGPRNEPPLTGARRAPGPRAEPPLSARRSGPSEPAAAPPAAMPATEPDRPLAPPEARWQARASPAPTSTRRAEPAPQPEAPADANEGSRPGRLRPPAGADEAAPRWRAPSSATATTAPQPERAPGPLATRPAAYAARAASQEPRRSPAPRDPAPSRLSYRMHRMWLTPVYRALFRVGLPAFALAFGIGMYLSDPDRRAVLAGTGVEAIRAIQERPEFMVKLMAIDGASPELAEAIRQVLPVDFPISSFDLDLEAKRRTVAEIDAVASADLRIRPGGILEIRVVERIPAVLWRGEGGLTMLDSDGHRVARVASRLDRPDLPVIAGQGAEKAVAEALALITAAEPVATRIRGLVRMGERRWDVVLDHGQRILLPEHDPVAAFERVMALAVAEEMLARDVTVIDMRNGQRPTLRLSPNALDQFRRGQELLTGATQG